MNLIDRTSVLWQGSLSLGLGDPADAPPPDETPSAAPDAATVVAGGLVAIDVLENDADPEGGALTLVAATADRGSVRRQSRRHAHLHRARRLCRDCDDHLHRHRPCREYQPRDGYGRGDAALDRRGRDSGRIHRQLRPRDADGHRD